MNPYTAPAESTGRDEDDARGARRLLDVEAKVRAIGVFVWFLAAEDAIFFALYVAGCIRGSLPPSMSRTGVVVTMLSLAVLGGLAATLALRLRRLRTDARGAFVAWISAYALACIAQFSTMDMRRNLGVWLIQTGMLAWTFHYVVRGRGRDVLDQQYRERIDASAHVRPTTARGLALLLVLLSVFCLMSSVGQGIRANRERGTNQRATLTR